MHDHNFLNQEIQKSESDGLLMFPGAKKLKELIRCQRSKFFICIWLSMSIPSSLTISFPSQSLFWKSVNNGSSSVSQLAKYVVRQT